MNDEIILQIDKLVQLQLKETDFMRNKMDEILLNKLAYDAITCRYDHVF